MKTRQRYGNRADFALDMWVKLARAAATFDRLSMKDIELYGLTGPQFAALEALGHLGAMTIGELGKKMLVTGGNMTVVIDNLQKEGLVVRKAGEKDRRSIMVDLTVKGRDMFNRIFPRHAAFIAKVASVLTEKEQRELAKLLKKLGTTCRAGVLD